MQNAKVKCGLTEAGKGEYRDDMPIDAYVWQERNYQHDDYGHVHQRCQLTYVEEGYQYFDIGHKKYLVPQHHVIWIPSDKLHRISSDARTVNLMVVLFKTVPSADFYQQVHVFLAPPVLREMLLYAMKWSTLLDADHEQISFLQAMLNSLPHFCKENDLLQIPAPADARLLAVTNYINNHYSSNITLDTLTEMAGMSARSLQRIFKYETGITLQRYMQLIRILKSVELLDLKQFTLSQIAHKVGYSSLSAFTAAYVTIMKSKPGFKR